MKKLLCATLIANKATKVDVESAYLRALPGFSIVGLPSQAIQESKDRIKSALLSIGFKFPAQKITINLSPSDTKKEGSHFDLPIAILIALQKNNCYMEDFFVFGELGLDGTIKSNETIFPLLLSLASTSKESLKVIVPERIAKKVALIPNLKVYGLKNLSEAIEFFKNSDLQQKFYTTSTDELFNNCLEVEGKQYYYSSSIELDFKDVKGQTRAKRASVIAAAGMHNLLLEGSPGCGKTMIAKRLPFILPPLSLQELLEVNSLHHSIDSDEFCSLRPIRSPHHSSSKPSIFGGGSNNAKAGEVALAHRGILFFDEFPHFSKQVLESLREPLEDKKVLISRVNTKVEYQTNFLFIAAQNPCPCGYSLSLYHSCTCNDLEIKRYKSKLSAPLLDRIDIYIAMDEQKQDTNNDYTTKKMRESVLRAFIFQKKRQQKVFNAHLGQEELQKYCILNEECKALFAKAIDRYGFSERGIYKALTIARTIADLEECDQIDKNHLLEALSYKKV